MSELEYINYVTSNKLILSTSTECACIYCFKTYHPSKITEWCSSLTYNDTAFGGSVITDTAICPYCSVDAVVSNSINYTADDLMKWHQQGFGN